MCGLRQLPGCLPPAPLPRLVGRRHLTERAIRIHEHGGPEVLGFEPVEVLDPGPGEVRLRHAAIGVNFRDVYERNGLYRLDLPSGLGLEAAGVVEALGPDVAGLKPGDRVACCLVPVGAYATARVYPADRLVKLPEGMSDEAAAALLLKGVTAWFLLQRIRPLEREETVLFHAAAGGVGLIACQWARHLGVRLIGTVGSEAKAKVALDSGADEVIRYREEDVAARVRELTAGEGVAVVYDSVGRDTWETSLASLRPRGLMVSFGNVSGPPPPVDLLALSRMGSPFVTRPRLVDYVATRSELMAGAGELFDLVLEGIVRPNVGQRFPLSEAGAAHRELEARRTIGSTVLLP